MLMVPMALSGWVATLAGWYTTEIGRQPWLVTGVLKTADAVGPVAGSHVALTLAVYLLLYVLLLVAYIGVLVHLALKAAKDGDTSPLPGVLERAAVAAGGGVGGRTMTYDWPTLLPLIFAGLMGLAILIYVVLDGFDLGIGILFAAPRTPSRTP